MKFSVCAIDRDLSPDLPFPLRGKSYEECAAFASRLGFDGIELQVQNPLSYNGKKLKSMFCQYGLKVSAVTTGLAYTMEGMSMVHEDPNIRMATIERLKRQLDLARELDSQILIGYLRGRKRPEQSKVNRRDGDVFCSTDRTMRFLEKFHSDWLVYNGDTYHMLSEDPDILAAIRRSLSKLVLFHVSDENRALPDDRHFNFHEAATVLKESRYDKWVSIECKPLPNSAEATRQGYAYLKRVFG